MFSSHLCLLFSVQTPRPLPGMCVGMPQQNTFKFFITERGNWVKNTCECSTVFHVIIKSCLHRGHTTVVWGWCISSDVWTYGVSSGISICIKNAKSADKKVYFQFYSFYWPLWSALINLQNAVCIHRSLCMSFHGNPIWVQTGWKKLHCIA